MTDRHRYGLRWISPILLLCACLVLPMVSPPAGAAVLGAGDPSEGRLHPVRIDGVAYLPLEQLADALGARVRRFPLKKKVELRAGAHTLVFTWLSSVVSADHVTYRMPLEARLRGGLLHVPQSGVLPLLEQVLGVHLLAGRPAARPPAPVQPILVDMQVEHKGDRTRLVLRADGDLARDRIVLEPGDDAGMSLLVRGVGLPPEGVASCRAAGHIREVSAIPLEDGVRIRIRSAGGPVRRDLQVSGDQVVLSLDAVRQPEADPGLWTIDTIVIDPGHGGKDPGAVGRGGAREKDIVLRVAKRLKPLLEKRLHLRVVLTRTGDVFVPLRERSRIAIRGGGRLFVSLHCNASKNRRSRGAEVYFLSDAKTAEAAEVAERENAVLRFEEEGDGAPGEADAELRSIEFGLLSTQFLKESQDLSACVRTEIAQTVTDLEDRGVKQANFYVMRGTMGAMPSLLIEMGFLSNPAEEKLLRSTAFQKGVAEAVFRGIRTFIHRYDSQLSSHR